MSSCGSPRLPAPICPCFRISRGLRGHRGVEGSPHIFEPHRTRMCLRLRSKFNATQHKNFLKPVFRLKLCQSQHIPVSRKRSREEPRACYSSTCYATTIHGLRADFMPRFAVYDLNGRHAASYHVTFAEFPELWTICHNRIRVLASHFEQETK